MSRYSVNIAAVIAAALITLCLGADAAAETLTVAHRGYWRADGSAQNSIRSLVKADSIGAYGSEFDVWLTADGVLLVNHDNELNGLTLSKVRSSAFADTRLANGEPLPRLEAYLAAAKGLSGNTRLVLELKPHGDDERERKAAKLIAKMLKKNGLKADLISFSLNGCRELKKAMPDMPVYYLNGDLSPEQIKAEGLDGIDYHFKVLEAHPEWIDRAHELGLKVNVWTVNSAVDMQKLIQRGVDYITTDHPEVMMNLAK